MNNQKKLGYFSIFPGILILLTFVFYPICLTFFYSLHYFKLTRLNEQKFIYFKNYIDILSSSEFYSALFNTSIIIFIVIILGLIGSFFVAFLLKEKTKITGLLTGIAIIPWALPPVVNGLIWKFIFYPEIGLINKIFYNLHIVTEPLTWLNNRYSTLFIIGIIVSWRVIPFSAILILTNLQAIPKSLYEAASIDGANTFEKFKYITLPFILPTIGVILCNFTLNSINVFDEIISLVGYRTLNETLIIYNYNQTFSFLNIGYGSSITYIIMLATGILGYIYILILKKGAKDDII